MIPDCMDAALDLAVNAGYDHLLYPGTLSTKRPRGRISLAGEATPELITRWKTVDYKDRDIAWLVRGGFFNGRILAILDTDTALAGVTANSMLPDTHWKVQTASGSSHYHRYFLLADDFEEYEDRGFLDEVDLKTGMNSYVLAPMNPGYKPEPGFGKADPPLLTAKVWNTYIGYMKSLRGFARPDGTAQVEASTTDTSELCSNTSLGWPREDHPYQCCGPSPSAWRNFLRNVCTRFVYTRWRSEGKVPPDLTRTLIYMQRVLDNNRCHEHTYDQFTKLIRNTWKKASERASDEGMTESQARKGRLRAEQLWAPQREAIAARNRTIVESLTAGQKRAQIARDHEVSIRTVARVKRFHTPTSPQGGG